MTDLSALQINAVATRLPDFSPTEPLTWFRRAETRFRLRGIKQQTTRADYVLEALPEAVIRSIGPWLDQQPDEIPYDDLKKHLLKEFCPSTSERARRLLLMPSQPMGDRKPSQLWDEICTLSRLPEIDDNSQQHKEVDLKKEIWLQSLPSCVRVLLHNTDEKSMVDLSTLADEILMSQNAAHRSTVSTAVEQQQQHSEVYTDDVMSAQRFGKHTERSQFRAMIEPDGICTYHKKFGSSARSCVHGCKWTSKNSRSGRF